MGQTASKGLNVYDSGVIIDVKRKYLNNVDAITEYIIFGYARKCDKILMQLYNVNIPISVLSLCAKYYYNPEYFDKINTQRVQLSNDNMSITKMNGKVWDNSCFGNRSIRSENKCIYKWHILIIKIKLSMYIGITTKSDTKKKFFAFDNIPDTDELFSYGYCLSNGKKLYKGALMRYGVKINEGDILCVVLDLNRKQISFMANDKDLGIAFRNVIVSKHIVYRLVGFKIA